MRAFSRLSGLLIALVATGVSAQITIPNIVQLPTEDFVWTWGRVTASGFDDPDRPEFTIQGNERDFRCLLTGSFRLGSRMRDFYEMREFEQSLLSTLYFIQDATATMNYYTQSNDLGWATLDCAVPDSEVSEDKAQQRLDRAVERAERVRDRRRSRQDDDDE
jgi:hypothetical protein